MPEGQGYGPPIQRTRLPDGRTGLRDAEGNTWVLDESLIETTGRNVFPGMSEPTTGVGAGMAQAANLAFGPETQTVGTIAGLVGGPVAGARAALGAGARALTGGAAKGMLPAVGQRLVRGGVGAGVGAGAAALPGVPGTPEQGALLGFGVGSGFAPGGIGPLFRHGMKVRGIQGGTKLLSRLLGLGDEVASGAGVRKHTGPGFLESIFGGADEVAGLPPGASTTQGAGRAGQMAQQIDEKRAMEATADALGRGSRTTSTLGPQAGLPSPPLNPQQLAAAEAAAAARTGRAAIPPGPVGAPPAPVAPAPAPPGIVGAPGAARVTPAAAPAIPTAPVSAPQLGSRLTGQGVQPRSTLEALEAGRGSYVPSPHLSSAENAAGELAAAAGKARMAEKAIQTAATAEARAAAMAQAEQAKQAALRAAQIPGAMDELMVSAPQFSTDIQALLGLLR